jgi:membrane protein implicated in regulation of membrane protease activity
MEISPTQIWIIIGAAMLIAELLSVSFVFAFLSLGALVTALLTWIGVLPAINAQLLCFSIVSVVSLFGLRKPLKAFIKRGKSLEYSEYIGDKATVVKAIPLQGEGRIFYRGTEWIAIAKDGQEIHKGKQVIIKELDGIKLIVSE